MYIYWKGRSDIWKEEGRKSLKIETDLRLAQAYPLQLLGD